MSVKHCKAADIVGHMQCASMQQESISGPKYIRIGISLVMPDTGSNNVNIVLKY